MAPSHVSSRPAAGGPFDPYLPMKHTLEYCQSVFNDQIIAAHFFNPRGDSFEKTPLGMLRSLSYQLLAREPSIYEHFVPIFREKLQKHRVGDWEWRELELKQFILSEIQRCQTKTLLLLVDALDECNESDVQNVVTFLKELSIKAIDAKLPSTSVCQAAIFHLSVWKSVNSWSWRREKNTTKTLLNMPAPN